jgi:hypothetical protein
MAAQDRKGCVLVLVMVLFVFGVLFWITYGG